MADTILELDLVDVSGNPLHDPSTTIDLFSSSTSQQFHVQLPLTGSKLRIALPNPGHAIYQVTITPSNYRVVQFFKTIIEGQTATRPLVVFPVSPNRVVSIDPPEFLKLPAQLQSFIKSAGAYDSATMLQKAALLNLYVKSRNTLLNTGQSVFELLRELKILRQDRLFATTTAALYEEAADAPGFHEVDGSLHEEIPPYTRLRSFKTFDCHGNLQLTFARNGTSGNDYLVDMDIDLDQGVGHIFEVIHNAVTFSKTSPFDVREILVYEQKLPSLYQYRFAAATPAVIA